MSEVMAQAKKNAGHVTFGLDLSKSQLLEVFKHHASKYSAELANLAMEYADNPMVKQEITFIRKEYISNAKYALNKINQSKISNENLCKITSDLGIHNVTFRFYLEQKTSDFKKIVYMNSPRVGMDLTETLQKLSSQEEITQGFNSLLVLVDKNRNNYALALILGLAYLRVKKNIPYALRYFEKAVQIAPGFKANHYKNLALRFVAMCHENNKNYKNALSTLLRMDINQPDKSLIYYEIARIYGWLGDEDNAIEYILAAVKHNSAYFVYALSEKAFAPMREVIIQEFNAHQELFGGYSKEFASYLHDIMKYVNLLNSRQIDEEVAPDLENIGSCFPVFEGGPYSAKRACFLKFYQRSFPEVLHMVAKMLKSATSKIEFQIEDHNERIENELVRKKKSMGPVSAIVTSILIFAIYQFASGYLPFDIPFVEYILAIAGFAAAWPISLKMIQKKMRKQIKNFDETNELRSGISRMKNLEEKIGSFWYDNLAKYIHCLPVWDEEAMASINDEMTEE